MKDRQFGDGSERRPVLVALVDGDEIVRTGVKAVLARHPDRVELIGHIGPAEDAVRAARHLRPDVVLVHFSAKSPRTLVMAGELAKAAFRVVILSEGSDPRWLFEALRLGVTGYLLRSSDGGQLVESLVRASEGTTVIDPDLATQLAITAAHSWDGLGWPGSQLGLTRRQSDVLRLLTTGLSNRLIADELVVGEETVKTHLRQIYRALGVRDRTQAVAFALRQGLYASESGPLPAYPSEPEVED